MKQKIMLTPDEINLYNEYKKKMLTSRTRSEVAIYRKRLSAILTNGRNRYISQLEDKNNSSRLQATH